MPEEGGDRDSHLCGLKRGRMSISERNLPQVEMKDSLPKRVAAPRSGVILTAVFLIGRERMRIGGPVDSTSPPKFEILVVYSPVGGGSGRIKHK